MDLAMAAVAVEEETMTITRLSLCILRKIPKHIHIWRRESSHHILSVYESMTPYCILQRGIIHVAFLSAYIFKFAEEPIIPGSFQRIFLDFIIAHLKLALPIDQGMLQICQKVDIDQTWRHSSNFACN
jgi:hypothetical protein